jgi:hypothetical protein
MKRREEMRLPKKVSEQTDSYKNDRSIIMWNEEE